MSNATIVLTPEQTYRLAEVSAGQAGESVVGRFLRTDSGHLLEFMERTAAIEFATRNGIACDGQTVGFTQPDGSPRRASHDEIREYHRSSHVVSILGDEVWLTENSGNYRPAHVGPASDYYWTFYAGKWRLWSRDAARENNRKSVARQDATA